MDIIAHRGLWKHPTESVSPPNSLPAIEDAFRHGYGIETDIRSQEGKLYLSHDPIVDPKRPPRFEEFLSLAARYPDALSFLNIKEDGLVPLLLAFRDSLAKFRHVFFDMSVPQLVQFSRSFSKVNLSSRYSEYEKNPSALDICDWIWVDAFERDCPKEEISRLNITQIKKLAIVSPELHGREEKTFWATLKSVKFEALCTDLPVQANEYFKG